MITKYRHHFRKSEAAFSLVEVVLALSVMSFSCVVLIGLLTTGLTSIQRSAATTVQAQIIQSVINNSEVTPYTNCASYYGITTNFYFDDEGGSVTKTDSRRIYTASVLGTSTTIPTTSGNTYTMLTNDCLQLQISISSVSNPNTTYRYSVVWPNLGK